MKVALYGLFDAEGKCRYVGATCNPEQREKNHRFTFGLEGRQFKCLKLFRWATEEQAWRIEPHIMKAFQRRGLADWNKRDSRRTYSGRPKDILPFSAGQLKRLLPCKDLDNHRATLARILWITKQVG